MDNDSSNLIIEKIGNDIMELASTNELNYIDACIAYCDEHDIEYDSIAEVVKKHQQLKNLVQSDAQSLHFMEKENATEFQYE